MSSPRVPFALIGLGMAAFLSAQPAAAQSTSPVETEAYQEAVEELMDLAGMDQMLELVMQQTWQSIQPLLENVVRQNAEASGKTVDQQKISRRMALFGDHFAREFTQEIDGAMPMIALIYARHFSLEEIQYLNWIYGRPTMRKLVARQPQLMQDMGQELSAWAEQTTPRIIERAMQKAKAEAAGQAN